jgi:protein-disulfide isomerase
MKKLLSFLVVAACTTALPGQTPGKKLPGNKAEITPKAANAPAAAEAPKTSALNKTTLESYVRHLQAWDHTITVEVGDPKPAPMDGFYAVNVHASKDQAYQDLVFYVSKDGKHILEGSVYQTSENPFKADLDKLKPITASAPNYGTAGAPVVIVEFSDFQCPYCKEEAKTLRNSLLTAYPKEVHLYHLDMPLEHLHPWARSAAVAGHCIAKQNAGAFWSYYDWIYEHQADMTLDNLTGKVMEWAKGKNDLDSLQLNRCMEAKETDSEVAKSIEEAKGLRINQTPFFFVNGRRMAGAVDWATLKHVIDDEIEYQKTAKNAGEDCGCSATLPSIGGVPTTTPLGGLK